MTMELEQSSQPVVVIPLDFATEPLVADPRFPGLIYGFPDDKEVNDAPEMLKVVSVLNAADITCFMVGTSALIYFGARRGRGDWQICVPSEKLQAASLLLQAAPNLTLSQSPPGVNIESLFHIFPRFKFNGILLWFKLVPSEDCHLECVPSNIEWSKNGLRYPKLEVFAQSLLDTFSGVALCDLIDGMNLSTDWGQDNLDLSGTSDVAWAKAKNERIRASVEVDKNTCMLELSEKAHSRRELWEEDSSGKKIPLGRSIDLGLSILRNIMKLGSVFGVLGILEPGIETVKNVFDQISPVQCL